MASNENASGWLPFGKFSLPITREAGKFKVDEFADSLTEGILNRLVRAQLTKGPKTTGKDAYRLRIDNARRSSSTAWVSREPQRMITSRRERLSEMCIPPRRSFTVPVSESVVKLLELKKGASGVRVVAVDLSGL